ncbi:MAG: metallophosphoesterase [Candidatus Margulisiibacteriota bacterium]|jgi:hypothetical protein
MKTGYYLKKILPFISKINFKSIDPEYIFNVSNFSLNKAVTFFYNLDKTKKKEFLCLLAIKNDALNQKNLTEFKKEILKKIFSLALTLKSVENAFRFFEQIPDAITHFDLTEIINNLYKLRSLYTTNLTDKKIIDNLIRILLATLMKEKSEIKLQNLNINAKKLITNLLPFHETKEINNDELLIKKLTQNELQKNNNLNKDILEINTFAQGDIHGALEKFIDNIYRLGLIDENGHFKAHNKKLIILGDMISGGKFSFETYTFIKRLKKEAQKLGSDVIILAGNHDLDIFFAKNNKRAIFTYAFYQNKKINKNLVTEFKKVIKKDIKNNTIQGFLWDKINNTLYSHGGFTKNIWDLFIKEQNLEHKNIEAIISKANEIFSNLEENINSVLFKENHFNDFNMNGPFWTDMRARFAKKIKPSFFKFIPESAPSFFQVIGHIRTSLISQNSPQKYHDNLHGIKFKYSKKTNGLGGTVFCDTGLSNLKDHFGVHIKKNKQNKYLFEGLQTILLVDNKKFIELRNKNEDSLNSWELRNLK